MKMLIRRPAIYLTTTAVLETFKLVLPSCQKKYNAATRPQHGR